MRKAGVQLLTYARKLLASEDFPSPLGHRTTRLFSDRLRRRAVHPEPTNAAPGTSDHGRGRAVDFVVKKGATTVAPISSSSIQTIWKAGGWEQKLMDACAGTRLRGPLLNPYESWHWWLG